jgi:hypothetical protein
MELKKENIKEPKSARTHSYLVMKEIEKSLNNPLLKPFLEMGIKEGTVEAKNFLFTQDFLQVLKDITNEFINQGVDLDRLGDSEFITLVEGKLIPFLVSRFISKEDDDRGSSKA